MKLVFGGAYNGKLRFVKDKYNISDDEIYFCSDHNLEYNKKVICGLHVFTKECILKDLDSLEILKNNLNALKDKIIICDEITSGIVPIEKLDRAWREETGRALQFLANNSCFVYRVFFGLSDELKKNINEKESRISDESSLK